MQNLPKVKQNNPDESFDVDSILKLGLLLMKVIKLSYNGREIKLFESGT